MKILDISRHQKGIKLADLKGVDGYIFRGGVGTGLDSCVLDFIEQAKTINKPFSFYTADYRKDTSEAVAEADFICDLADKYGCDYPIFFDCEYFSATYIKNKFGVETTASLVQSLTTAFCEQVKARGYKTGFYFNKDYYTRFYGTQYIAQHEDYVLWLARPNVSAPDIKCDLWQYASDNGSEFGYNGNIDKNEVINDEYFKKDTTVEVKPISNEPIKLIVGKASGGDIRAILKLCESLGIPTTISTDPTGYITTDIAVSSGDQLTIVKKCLELSINCEQFFYESEGVITFINAEEKERQNNGKTEALTDLNDATDINVGNKDAVKNTENAVDAENSITKQENEENGKETEFNGNDNEEPLVVKNSLIDKIIQFFKALFKGGR